MHQIALAASGVLSTVAATVWASVPEVIDSNGVWLWRGVLYGSLLLNLFFLKKVYHKVSRIEPQARAIRTLTQAIEFMAREGDESGNRRRVTDPIVISLLAEVKKITDPEVTE